MFLSIELALPCAKRTHLATDGYSKKKKKVYAAAPGKSIDDIV